MTSDMTTAELDAILAAALPAITDDGERLARDVAGADR
jgi:hypothetical protein